MSADDSALVRRCLDGRDDALRDLVKRFQSEVYGLCVRMLRQHQDAEDVTQEVFIRIFRSLHKWDPERPLKPWVMGITINRCRTWLSQKHRRPEPVNYLEESAGRPDEGDSTELVSEIQSALHQLRPDFRVVFVMFHEQGQSYEEISIAMDRPVGTIKTWLHRARLEVLDQLRRRGMLPDSETPTGFPIQPPLP